jgi:hypothetical protein
MSELTARATYQATILKLQAAIRKHQDQIYELVLLINSLKRFGSARTEELDLEQPAKKIKKINPITGY